MGGLRAAAWAAAGLALGGAGLSGQTVTITTIAGVQGKAGGSDGVFNSAQFDLPVGIAVDQAGNAYVADEFNDTIREVTPAGVVTTIAGAAGLAGRLDGPVAVARFNLPTGIAVDSAGNIYVADQGNNEIRKIAGGQVSTFAGGAGSLVQFSGVNGVGVDAAGNVYVADGGLQPAIWKITSAGFASIVAGGGTEGYADGNGAAARFYNPEAVVADASGNLYVADTNNGAIRKIDASGNVTTLAGSPSSIPGADGTGTSARFNLPTGLAIDGTGNLYVADSGDNSLREVTPAGVVTTIAGITGDAGSYALDGTGSAVRFSAPTGIARDASGNLYITDRLNELIRTSRVFAPIIAVQPQGGPVSVGATTILTVTAFGSPSLSYQWFFNGSPIGSSIVGSLGAMLNLSNVQPSNFGAYTVAVANPEGVTVSNVAQITAGTLPVLAAVGQPVAYAGIPYTLALTASNSPASFQVRGLPPGLTLDSSTGVISGTPTAPGAYQIAITASNATGTSASITTTLTVEGTPFTAVGVLAGGTSAGSADGVGTGASFDNPNGLAADGFGNLYVADTGNHTIRKISPTGVVTTLAGLAGQAGSVDGDGTNARFDTPYAVAADSAGNVYVADTGNDLIRKISPQGVVSTFAGSVGQAGSSDSPGARFNAPMGIAVDGAGNVYVSDTGNDAIRKIGPDGTVSTLAGLAGEAGDVDAFGSGARFNQPTGIAVDGSGNIYVSDLFNDAVRKITPGGSVSTLAATPGGSVRQAVFNGVAVDASATVYTTFGPFRSQYTETTILAASGVEEISPGGVLTSIQAWNNLNSVAPVSTFATGVAVSASGDVFALVNGQVEHYARATGPTITAEPASETAAQGGSAVLSVSATGSPALAYQWYFNGSAIAGATSATLALAPVQASSAGTYTVQVSTSYGSALSSSATLTVLPASSSPEIATAPQPVIVSAGLGATLSATASSANGQAVTYQWLKNGSAIAGATGSTLTLSDAQAADAGLYTVTVSNGAASTTSAAAAVGVDDAPGETYLKDWTACAALTAGVQFTSVAFDGSHYLAAGSDGSVLVSADAANWTSVALPAGSGRLNSLIYVGAPYGFVGVGDNGNVVAFAGPSYAGVELGPISTGLLTGVAVGNGRIAAVGYGGGVYSAALAGGVWSAGTSGTTNSLNAVAFGGGQFVAVGLGGTVLTSSDGLAWSTQTFGSAEDLYSVAYGPAGFVALGISGGDGLIYFSPDGTEWTQVATSGGSPLIRIVYSNGAFVAVGSNGAVLVSTDGGFDWTPVDTGAGSTLEGVTFGAGRFVAVGGGGMVAQSAVANARLVNLSASGFAGNSGQSLIAGFVIGGSGSKPVLVRGVGPTLAQFGVSDPVANPQLTLFGTDAVVLGENAGWGGGPALAALFQQVYAFALPSNSADAALMDSLPAGAYTAQVSGQPGGTALAEVYDADSLNAPARLVNLSATAQVGAAGDMLIGGFVVSGTTAENVLIRGVGPGLAGFGISGVLEQPVLTLYDANGNALAANTAWGGSAALANAFASVGAFALAPTSNDTALLVTLAPGAYTAQLSGANGATGAGLLELYEVAP